jgi:hypothetical protein
MGNLKSKRNTKLNIEKSKNETKQKWCETAKKIERERKKT